MSVEFNNQPIIQKAQNIQSKHPLMVQKLIDWGVASDEKKANMYLTILAVLFLASSLFVWFT